MAIDYPPVGFYFKVDFPGIGSGDKDARFQEVTGLTAEMATEELPVGGENRFVYRLPTRPRYPNVVLKRGMLNDSGLIGWFRDAIENFIFKPIDINVRLLNKENATLSTWKFMQAYPVKWVISDFKAQENAFVIESIELSYQYFSRIQ
jgi:phage tail-like protein